MGDPLGGRVGAMGRAEGVVHVEVGQLRERFGQVWVVLRLPLLPAAVLQEEHLAWLERLRLRDDLVAHHSGRERHRHAQEPGQAIAYRAHRELVTALRPAEVRDQDHLRVLLEQELDGGQRRPDPRVVGDRRRLRAAR